MLHTIHLPGLSSLNQEIGSRAKRHILGYEQAQARRAKYMPILLFDKEPRRLTLSVVKSQKKLGDLGDLFLLLGLVEGIFLVGGSGAEDSLAVLGGQVDVVVELGSEVVSQKVEVVVVFLSDIGDGDAGGVLEADELAEGSLALDDAEWSVGGSAELRQPADELDWVAVGSNDNELGGSAFN